LTKQLGLIKLMGGPCYLKSGVHFMQAPPCTDNFQVIDFFFPVGTSDCWHSVEQCFQAQKFNDPTYRKHIQESHPKLDESDASYGHYVWNLGQSKHPIRSDWEEVKVELMYQIVCAKYAANSSLCRELLSTGNVELFGNRSTWQWSKWNGLIQMFIRSHLQRGTDIISLASVWTSRQEIEDSACT
jgi:predicted NAD-dependent protein-ADP-ribosyltransferase YbiA (DUF1768 family)